MVMHLCLWRKTCLCAFRLTVRRTFSEIHESCCNWSLTPSDHKNIKRRSSRPDSIKVDVLPSVPSTSNVISKPKLSSLFWVLWVARSLFCGFESLRQFVIIKVGYKNLTVTNCVIYFRMMTTERAQGPLKACEIAFVMQFQMKEFGHWRISIFTRCV